jgi:hypothetical protein
MMTKIIAEIEPGQRARFVVRCTACGFSLDWQTELQARECAQRHADVLRHRVVIEDTETIDMCHGNAAERAVCGGSDARCRRDPACNE